MQVSARTITAQQDTRLQPYTDTQQRQLQKATSQPNTTTLRHSEAKKRIHSCMDCGVLASGLCLGSFVLANSTNCACSAANRASTNSVLCVPFVFSFLSVVVSFFDSATVPGDVHVRIEDNDCEACVRTCKHDKKSETRGDRDCRRRTSTCWSDSAETHSFSRSATCES